MAPKPAARQRGLARRKAEYRGWHRVQDPGSMLAYLRSSVLNGCRSALRSRGRRQALHQRAARHDPPVWSAEAAVIDCEDRRAVLAAVANLPPRQREVLVLKFYLGLGEREVAATLRISRGAVSSTAARALASLTRQLREQQ